MNNSDSSGSAVVAIIAIIAVFVVAYFGLMLFNKQADTDTDGTPVIDINVDSGGDTPPPPAQ